MRKIIAYLILFMSAASISLAAVQVAAQVDASRPIYADSSFTYSIIVANGSQPENVDLAPIKSFNPSSPSTQQQTSVVNGQASSYNILSYQLVAGKPGQYTLPPLDVTVGGKIYKTNSVDFTVVEAGSTQQIDAQLQLSDTTCYVGQPVVLTFEFYVWTDIVRNEQITNINFRVPILDDDSFYVEDVDTAVTSQRQGQIAVNGKAQPVTQDQVVHAGVDCVRVSFSKVLIPRQAGDINIEAASASADLAVSQAAPSRRSFFDFGPQYEYKRFNAVAKPLAMKVLPLADSGKPADFYGLVGNYTISASAQPTKVNVGDPITLTISIGGSAYLKPVQWPNLEAIEAFKYFKIPAERADGEIKGGQKVFTQTIRAGSEAVTQVPPVPLSFFDASSGKYKTVYSQAIPLDVAPTRTVTGADIESNTQFTSARRQMQSIKEGLSANYTSADALIDQQFELKSLAAGTVFWAFWTGPSAMLLLSAAGRALTNQNPQRITARRRRNAFSAAARSIRKIGLQNVDCGPELARALKQYVADKFNKVAGAITPEDARKLIQQSAGDETLALEFKHTIESAEASAYSPAAFAFNDQSKNETIKLLREVDKKLK